MFKKLNVRGVSHHLLLPVLAVLVVASIGGFIMQRSSSAATVYTYTNAQGKTCYGRTLSKGITSVCVGYALKAIKTKVTSAPSVTAGNGVTFGPAVAKAVTTYNKKNGRTSSSITSKTWANICTNSTITYMIKIGCPGYAVFKKARISYVAACDQLKRVWKRSYCWNGEDPVSYATACNQVKGNYDRTNGQCYRK